jgi:hypothetical protein
MNCELCGGELVVMGQLGRLEWSRCRNCGMEFSSEAWEPTPEDGDQYDRYDLEPDEGREGESLLELYDAASKLRYPFEEEE